jgi:hypothetical protein
MRNSLKVASLSLALVISTLAGSGKAVASSPTPDLNVAGKAASLCAPAGPDYLGYGTFLACVQEEILALGQPAGPPEPSSPGVPKGPVVGCTGRLDCN